MRNTIPRGVPEKVLPQTVSLHMHTRTADGQGLDSFGAGVILDAEGLILTCAHVLDGNCSVIVTLYDGTTYVPEIIAKDDATDLALLRIKPRNPLVPVTFADMRQMHLGDPIFAVGTPLAMRCAFSITLGRVSHQMRYKVSAANPALACLQTDTPLNAGNSGGGVFNANGQLVGIGVAIETATGSEANLGIGYATRADDIAAVLPRLRAKGCLPKPQLGMYVDILNAPTALALGLEKPEGCLVREVQPQSVAHVAGLQPLDVITQVAAMPTPTQGALMRAVYIFGGKRVTLKVWRQRRYVTLKATIAEANLPQAQLLKTVKTNVLGMWVKPVKEGLEVVRITPQSPAILSGIEPEDVLTHINQNGKWRPLKTADDLKKAANEGKPLLLRGCFEGVDRVMGLLPA